MFLFVFEPSKTWAYCGGAIGIIAGTFEEATNMLVDNIYGDNPRVYTQDPMNRSGTDDWVLTHKFELANPGEKRVGFINYNYS